MRGAARGAERRSRRQHAAGGMASWLAPAVQCAHVGSCLGRVKIEGENLVWLDGGWRVTARRGPVGMRIRRHRAGLGRRQA